MKKKSPLAIVVLISGKGSNLQAILTAIANQKLHVEVQAVISNRSDAGGLHYAQQAGIPTHVISKQDFPQRESYDQQLQICIERYQPQLIVLAGFMRILGADFVNHYAGKLINIHPSLLPKYRGLDTHAKALAAHDAVHGMSIHFVTETLDGGPIIGQAHLSIHDSDTPDSLAKRVQQLEHHYYPVVIEYFAQQRIRLSNDQICLDDKILPSQGCSLN